MSAEKQSPRAGDGNLPPGWVIRDRSDLEPGVIDIEGPGYPRTNIGPNPASDGLRTLHALARALLAVAPAAAPSMPTDLPPLPPPLAQRAIWRNDDGTVSSSEWYDETDPLPTEWDYELPDQVIDHYTADQMRAYARAAIAAAPAAPAQPVAKVISWTNGSYWRNYKLAWMEGSDNLDVGALLYAAPAAAPAVLTDEQIAGFLDAFNNDRRQLGDYEAFAGTARDIWDTAFKASGSQAPATGDANG